MRNGSKKEVIIFDNNNKYKHYFIMYQFNEMVHGLRAQKPGCYIFIYRDENCRNKVIYAGQSQHIAIRVFDHSYNIKERFNNITPTFVLVACDPDGNIREDLGSEGNRHMYEEILHYLFVPEYSTRHKRAKIDGLKNGNTNYVEFSSNEGNSMQMKWASLVERNCSRGWQ